MTNDPEPATHLIWVVNTPAFGGLEQLTLTLAQALPARFRSTLVVSAGSRLAARARALAAPAAAVEVPFPLKLGRWRGLEWFFPGRRAAIRALIERELDRLIRPGEPTTVIFQTFLEKLVGTVAARRRGARVVWIEHGPLPWWFRLNPFLLGRYRTTARAAAAVVAVSDTVGDSLRAAGAAADEVIANAVPAPASASDRALAGGLIRVGYLGRLERAKGALLLPALARLLPADRFEVVVAGAGRQAEQVRAAAAGTTLRFLGHTDQPAAVLDSCHLLVYPSRAAGEGLPLIILEAFARGIPVIAFPTGGVPAAVRHGENGLLVATPTAAALADAVRDLAADPDRYRAFSRSARATATERFPFAGFLAAYARILTDPGPAGWTVTSISGEDRLDHGGGVHTVEMARALARRFGHVNLIVPRGFPDDPALAAEPSVTLIRLPLKLLGKTWLPLGRLGAGRLRQLRHDLIIERYYCTGSLARSLARTTGAPYAIEANHPHHLEVRAKYGLPAALTDRMADAVLTGARVIVAPTAAIVPIHHRNRVLPLRWGVDRSRFSRITAESFDRSPRTVIFTGSFRDWHGLPLLPAAIREAAADPTLRFRLVGGTDAQRADFRAACEGAGVPAAAVILDAPVPYGRVPEILAGACLGLAPYDPARHPFYPETGFYWTPFKILEYLAAGLPVVTTDAPALRELVEANGYGLCVPAAPAELGRAIRQLTSDRELWLACHRAIATTFDDRFSWDAFLDQFLARVVTTHPLARARRGRGRAPGRP